MGCRNSKIPTAANKFQMSDALGMPYCSDGSSMVPLPSEPIDTFNKHLATEHDVPRAPQISASPALYPHPELDLEDEASRQKFEALWLKAHGASRALSEQAAERRAQELIRFEFCTMEHTGHMEKSRLRGLTETDYTLSGSTDSIVSLDASFAG